MTTIPMVDGGFMKFTIRIVSWYWTMFDLTFLDDIVPKKNGFFRLKIVQWKLTTKQWKNIAHAELQNEKFHPL
jgi:hypothetical protein